MNRKRRFRDRSKGAPFGIMSDAHITIIILFFTAYTFTRDYVEDQSNAVLALILAVFSVIFLVIGSEIVINILFNKTSRGNNMKYRLQLHSHLQATPRYVRAILGKGGLKGVFQISTIILAIVTIILTFHIISLTSNDVPNFPTTKYRIDTVNTYSYIDGRHANNTIYDVEYLIKYSKVRPPKSYDFSIPVPENYGGIALLEESRGLEIKGNYFKNNKIEIENENLLNPLLLHVVYVSKENHDIRELITDKPLPDIENNSILYDSFFVKIENIGGHDIKTVTLNSNVTNWINVDLIQLDSSSWINQPIMIYDNGFPVIQTKIDGRGIITWEISSINSGEQKVYYFKKIDEYTSKQ